MTHTLVTGLHRSGTRFVSKCIAHDSARLWQPEETIAWASIPMLKQALNRRAPCVFQVPFLLPIIHEFAGDHEVVFVRRPLDEINASKAAAKLNWSEQVNWQRIHTIAARALNLTGNVDYSAAVLNCWEAQKRKIKHWREVDYSAFANHPLYVPKAERVGWHVMQDSNDFAVHSDPGGGGGRIIRQTNIPRQIQDAA